MMDYQILSAKKYIQKKYDDEYDCAELNHLYTVEMQSELAADNLLKYERVNTKSDMKISGILTCFCEDQFKILGHQLFTQTWNDSFGNPTAVCYSWLVDSYTVMGVSYVFGFIIQSVNVFLKKFVIYIIKKTKFHTVSEETSATMITVYFMQLFNTAFMVLLLEANFSEFKNPLFNFFFSQGRLTDFNEIWYKRVGKTLVVTM